MDKYFSEGPGRRLLQTFDQEDFVRDEVSESPGMIWLGGKQQQQDQATSAYSSSTYKLYTLQHCSWSVD